MKKIITKRGIKGVIFSLTISFFFLFLHVAFAFDGLNNFFMDRIYQRPKAQNTNIFIVAIDDKSIEELGRYDDWNRGYYAKVINNLNKYNPAVIGIDVVFSGETKEHPEYDLELVNACKDKNVVVGSKLDFGLVINNEKFTATSKVKGELLPYEDLANTTEYGYTDSFLDKSDGIARKVVPLMQYDGNTYTSFSYKIYDMYTNKLGLNKNKYAPNQAYRFNYATLPNDGYTVVSFADVYNDKINLFDIEDSIVLIGGYAAILQDNYYTPIKSSKLAYGVTIHANIIDAYLRSDTLVDANNILMTIVIFLVLVIFAYLIFRSNIIISSVSEILSIGILLGIQTLLYINKIYYPFMDLILALIITYIAYIGFKYGEELVTRFKTVNVFKKYVAPQVVDKALKNVDYKVNVGGEKRHIACLFVDIRGFTPLSEGLEPEAVVSILNEYLTLTTNSIFSVGGTLDKFIGDATMAIFNAPFDLEDYEFKAVKAAWLIAKGSEEIDRIAMERFGKHVSFGIGVNSGYAVVGNIGSKTRIDYTAIGDTVNTAARLEANAKAGEILISEELYNSVKDRIDAICIGGLSLKGKSKEVIAYKVIGIKGE